MWTIGLPRSTAPCPILVMLSARLGSDKYQRFSHRYNATKVRTREVRILRPTKMGDGCSSHLAILSRIPKPLSLPNSMLVQFDDQMRTASCYVIFAKSVCIAIGSLLEVKRSIHCPTSRSKSKTHKINVFPYLVGWMLVGVFCPGNS